MQSVSRWLQVVPVWWRHALADVRGGSRYFNAASLERIGARVTASEREHTGQIRVCIETHLPASDLWRFVTQGTPIPQLTRQRAQTQFAQWRVWDTEHNNGVLIYLLLAERAIEVVADRGINPHVTPEQWQNLVQQMQAAFKQSAFEAGLVMSVAAVTELLTPHFPMMAASVGHLNELSDAPQLI